MARNYASGNNYIYFFKMDEGNQLHIKALHYISKRILELVFKTHQNQIAENERARENLKRKKRKRKTSWGKKINFFQKGNTEPDDRLLNRIMKARKQ